MKAKWWIGIDMTQNKKKITKAKFYLDEAFDSFTERYGVFCILNAIMLLFGENSIEEFNWIGDFTFTL